MIMVKEEIEVEEVQYGEDMVEVLGLTIRSQEGERRRIILTYVPPKTNT